MRSLTRRDATADGEANRRIPGLGVPCGFLLLEQKDRQERLFMLCTATGESVQR